MREKFSSDELLEKIQFLAITKESIECERKFLMEENRRMKREIEE